MAARGAMAKEEVFKKILETFPGSFMQDDKILRIPRTENGETVEIKVTLTAAKDVLGAGAGVSDRQVVGEFDWSEQAPSTVEAAAAAQPTEAEKENIRKMMEALGL